MASTKQTTRTAKNEPVTLAEWKKKHEDLREDPNAHPNEIEHARKMSLGGHPDYKGGERAMESGRDEHEEIGDDR